MTIQFETIDIDTETTVEDETRHQLATRAQRSPWRNGAVAVRRAWQRGMATAEYAVGILAAVALALVLLKVFTNQDFFTTALKFVISLIGKVGGMIP